MKKFVVSLLGIAVFSTGAHASLLAYYNFDNPAQPLADSSGNGTNITGTAGTNPVWGSALGYNNSGAYDYTLDRLIVPIDVNPGSMPDMTWGAWVRTDSLASGLRKVMGHDDGAWDRVLGLDNRAPDGTFRYTAFTGTNNNGPVEGGPAPINTTDWTFIAASHTGSQITLYVDLNASTTGDPLISITEAAVYGPGFNTFAIGGIRPDVESESWDGVIDQVFVYNEVLSGAQLTQFRNQGFVIPEPSAGLLGGLALALVRRRRR